MNSNLTSVISEFKMDRSCDFMSFSAVFQSYQDNGSFIMKSCVRWNPMYD